MHQIGGSRWLTRPRYATALLLIVALAGCDKSNDLTGVQQPPPATPTPLPGFTISGTVHGPSGVSSWSVWAISESQGGSTNSDSSGHYAITNLPAGNYTLHARSGIVDGQGTAQATVPPDAVVDLYIRPPH